MPLPRRHARASFVVRHLVAGLLLACGALAVRGCELPGARSRTPEEPVARVKAGDLPIHRHRGDPERIDDDEALRAVTSNVVTYHRLRDQIDFDTDYYLLFRDRGYPRTSMTLDLVDGEPPRAVFTWLDTPRTHFVVYHRPHVYLYRVRRDVEWTLEHGTRHDRRRER